MRDGECREGKNKFDWGLRNFNGKLISDATIQESINASWNRISDDAVNILERWEHLKETVKMIAIGRSSTVSNESRMRKRTLQNNLKYLCTLECDNPGMGGKDIE